MILQLPVFYTQDRESVIYIFALILSVSALHDWWKAGNKRLPWTCLYVFLRDFCISAACVSEILTVLDRSVCMFYYDTGYHVSYRRSYTEKTCAATLGTLAGVVLAGISAWCFSKASGISGYNVSDIETLMTLWNTNRIQVGGLLFSGLLISCLGAVMDVAMSISSAIDEIYKQNSSLTRTELFKAGLRVGRDMMGTDSNTLILAFAGSSVSTLLLDYAYDLPYQQIINSNNIGIAIMQGLAGSFGIVFSVPFTVLICTVLFA